MWKKLNVIVVILRYEKSFDILFFLSWQIFKRIYLPSEIEFYILTFMIKVRDLSDDGKDEKWILSAALENF